MRIAYLCKRHYMNHDVIVDRYARLYEQPYQLARLGHDVLGLCLSYRPGVRIDVTHDAAPGELRWLGLSPGRHRWALPAGLASLPAAVLDALRDFTPDILVAASDCLHVILGGHIARKLRIPFAADLYDHFETFGLAKIPGVTPRYRHELRHASLVSCVSEPLADLVKNSLNAKGEVIALPSTIDRSVFHPRDRGACREALGLPANARLVGTAGALSEEKGIEPLYSAFMELSETFPDIHLVLAGSTDPKCPPPESNRVHFLGKLPHQKTAMFFSALDVGVVYLRDTPYGRYSFPQKAYEMAACGTPMAVANVGAMAALCRETPSALYEADNADALARCISRQLAAPAPTPASVPSWADQALILSQKFDAIARDYRGRSASRGSATSTTQR